MIFREQFDRAPTPQGAAFALGLGQLYNVTQPIYAIGELIYSSTTTELASLAPNTSTSKMFLSMTGTGSAGAAPVWETIEAADITNFNEAVDDRAAALIQNGTGISWSYNDGAGTLTPTVTLAPFTTSDLAEGSNLYFTNERVDDRVDALIQDGTGITWTYDDGANTLTPTVTITQYTDEMAQDAAASLIQDGTGISWSYNDGSNTLTPTVSLAAFSTSNLSEGSNLYYTDERVDDRVDALIQDGTGITWSYNDGAGTLTPTVTLAPFTTSDLAEGSNLYYTDERVDDRVDALVQDGGGLTWTYNDGSGTLTPSVASLAITYNSAADANVTGAGTVTTLDLDTELEDYGSDFATDTYTADADGALLVCGHTLYDQMTVDAARLVIQIVTSDATFQAVNIAGLNATSWGMPFAAIVPMDAGDTASITVTVSGMAGDTADILGNSGGGVIRTFASFHRIG